MTSKALILHGSSMSTCTSRVLATIGELGLVEGKDYILDDISDFHQVKSPEWVANQPFGQMPYLEDPEEGLVIFESRAISRYIATKYKSPLAPLPSDGLAKYAAFEQAVFSESQQIDASASTILGELMFNPMHGRTTNQANAEASVALLAKKLEAYNTILGERQFVGGDELTVADLWHMPDLQLVQELGKVPTLLDGSLPNVTRWYKAVQASKGWQFALAQGFGKFP